MNDNVFSGNHGSTVEYILLMTFWCTMNLNCPTPGICLITGLGTCTIESALLALTTLGILQTIINVTEAVFELSSGKYIKRIKKVGTTVLFIMPKSIL